MTTIGELLPSSIVTFLMPAISQMRLPTGTLPVKLILRARVSRHNAPPISPPGPVRHEIASAGNPDSKSNSVSFNADNGVADGGLMITALPAAIAGATLCATRFSGKLNGVMATTTPHGTRTVNPNLP